MSIEELARAASADLNTAVLRQVSPVESRASLRGRVRARRFERAVAALAVVALTAVGMALVRDLASPVVVPAGPPTVDRAAPPASECLFDVTCTDGTYRAALAIPTTFSPQGVLEVSMDTGFQLDLTEINNTFAVTLLAQPLVVGASGSAASPPPTAQELARELQGRGDLQVSGVTPGVLAGRTALVFDVRPSPKAAHDAQCLGMPDCLALFTSSAAGDGWAEAVGIGRDEVDRIFLVDVPGAGTVAVLVRDRTAGDYAPLVALTQASPVLASLAFGD